MWFRKLMGFYEEDPEQVRANIKITGNKLISKINKAEYVYGRLEISSLEKLRAQSTNPNEYNSIKVAKYKGADRIDLIENNEYGYCSLIKATKAVLDKIEIENRTSAIITSKERKELRLWDAIAIREAVINAIVHNDYTREIPPKFEIFF